MPNVYVPFPAPRKGSFGPADIRSKNSGQVVKSWKKTSIWVRTSCADVYAPPPPPISVRHFLGEGGEGVYFEAPRGRNFIPPPPPFLYTPPHPQKLIFRVGGWGCIKVGPVKMLSGFQELQEISKVKARGSGNWLA